MTQAGRGDGQFSGINRTICIGLGGTGRDVLMRIRRLIVDRYGNLENLPIVSFIHIDTDKSAAQYSGLRGGSSYHGIDLSFQESEKVSATIESRQVSDLVQGLESRFGRNPAGPYANIARWFPPALANNIKAVEEGAKGIRPVGRLAFFHNYQKVKRAIESAERRTHGHEAKLLKAGLQVDNGLNIFVVGSLCGGTGSGMFLDVAYSLRKFYANKPTNIFGYLVISPKLYGNTPSMSANTYAALKELNHYTTPGSTFEALYDMQDAGSFLQEKRPPFDYVYLVSNENSEGYEILEQRKLCNVIAHKIALDFFGELAPVVKGMRDNFLQYLIQWDEHPRPNVQRYLTFGLSAIYFPRDIIVQIALNRISLKLVNFWLNGEGQSPDPQLLLEQFLLRYNWHTNIEKRDGFTIRIAEAVQESNKTFNDTINTWRSKLDRTINELKSNDDRLDIRQQLPREFREQFRKVQSAETENLRGVWLTRLLQIRPNITKQLVENITDFLTELMTPNNLNFSLRSARNWVEALITELQNNQRQLEQEIRDFGGMKKPEDLDKRWREGEQKLEEIERKTVVPLLNTKNSDFQAEAKRIVRSINDLIKNNFDLAATQEALGMINDLLKYVQDISSKIDGLNSLVANIESNYKKRDSALLETSFDEMSGEAIFEKQDIEECYSNLLPQEKFRGELVLASQPIISRQNQSQSLAVFLVDRFSPDQLQGEIDLTVDQRFGALSRRLPVSVIKRFIQYYLTEERVKRLQQIRNYAQPLLHLNRDIYFRDNEAKKSQLIGFKDSDEQEVKDLKSILQRNLAIDDNVFKPTQAEDEILFVHEYAGFPLRIISGLRDMQSHYFREQNFGNAFLHNDARQKFTDIIPPDPNIIEELEDIFYPCLAFGLIKPNPTNKQLEFNVYDQLRNSYEMASLSLVWHQALEELALRRDMRDTLERLLNGEIAKIDGNPQLWDTHYLPMLRTFVKEIDSLKPEDPNYPYRSTVVGVRATTTDEGKPGIIDRFRTKMEHRFNRGSLGAGSSGSRPPHQQDIEVEVVEEPQSKLSSSPDLIQELERLGRLREKGLLTEAEFVAAKKTLLGI